MSEIFKSSGGSVIIENANTTPSILTVSGLSLRNLMILTSFSLNRGQTVQYIKTLDDNLFGYSWGEDVGAIVVGGMIFLSSCSGNGGGSGISTVNSFYNENNVHQKGGPVSVSMGGISFRGYLEKMSINATSGPVSVAEFSLQFSVLKKI